MDSSNAPSHSYSLRKRKASLPQSIPAPNHRDTSRKRKLLPPQLDAVPHQRCSPRKLRARLPDQEELASRAKLSKREEEDETPTTHINDLPDELLGRVIRELGLKERVFSELVCRQWNRVSRAYGWLNFRLIADGQLLNYTRSACSVERKLKCLLSRCATTLREIDLSGIRIRHVLGERICELIPCGTRKLETLSLNRIRLESPQLTMIGNRLPGLKSISLAGCFENAENPGSEGLTSLLTSCRRLESLNLSRNRNLTANLTFSQLPATLRRLDVSHCYDIHSTFVDGLLATCAGNLRVLRMRSVGLNGCTNRHLERLFTGLGSLEELHFSESLRNARKDGALGGEEEEDYEVSTRLECIGVLKNLRRLLLDCTKSVTAGVLNQIVACCRELESLELIGKGNLSKKAVSQLTQLPKLIQLQLYWHPSIDDGTLAQLARGPARLRKLDISACKKVTDKGIRCLLEGCGGQLRKINVNFCPLVTKAMVAKLEKLYNDSSDSDIE